MPDWERALERWRAADLIDGPTADRIREFEGTREPGWRLPIVIALALGAMLLGAGVLLFVSANWDSLGPAARMALIVLLTAIFHVTASFLPSRFPALATTLHALGTVALGAGVFLAGQIFHLEAEWTEGVLLWAVGAWVAYALLRDEAQFFLAAVLTPAWVTAEWIERAGRLHGLGDFLLLLSLAYLTSSRRTLMWAGEVALLPSALFLVLSKNELRAEPFPWLLGLLLPLPVALVLRGRATWLNAVATIWVAALLPMHGTLVYFWCAAASVGLIAWGVWESREERINIGMAGFAATILAFYFSSVMDRLDRSMSLVVLGLLFLAGGWALERVRRRLVAQAREFEA